LLDEHHVDMLVLENCSELLDRVGEEEHFKEVFLVERVKPFIRCVDFREECTEENALLSFGIGSFDNS
jgi:hypothetical protein